MNLRKEILEKVKQYYKEVHAKQEFEPGKQMINFAGRVYDEKEMQAMVDSVLDFWLTLAEKGDKFEEEFAKFLGTKYALLTNSGSSANLLAISALCSSRMGNRQLRAGDEVITTAVTFPTTLNPIIQNNLVPVLIDVNLDTLNIDTDLIEKAVTRKTKAIFVAHTLGNPNDMNKIKSIAKKHNLFVIEDTCDALASTYASKKCGSIGDLGTFSFYPAHHMTLGEGGAVVTDDLNMYKILKSLRDWGRDCYCKFSERSHLGACKARFEAKIQGIPYDHRYLYSTIGYNLKPLDIQAAMGSEQLKKLPGFTKKRKENFAKLKKVFSKYDCFLIPKEVSNANASWFGFPITLKGNFDRKSIITFFEENKIQTRLMFGGNIIYHPAYKDVNFKIPFPLKNSDVVVRNTFFIGTFPKIQDKHIKYIEKVLDKFMKNENTVH